MCIPSFLDGLRSLNRGVDMMYLYTGTPGSGKSLHCAKQIRDNLVWGAKLVVGNIGIDISKIKPLRGTYLYVDNDELTPDRLVEISHDYFVGSHPKESCIKLYIDEAQLLFNAREWANVSRKGWVSFFTQHRKLGYDIYLITQFDRMIDRQLRSLVEYELIHRKVSNFGWRGKLISFWSFGKLFMYAKRYYPLNEKIGSSYYLCKKRDWQIYDTFKQW